MAKLRSIIKLPRVTTEHWVLGLLTVGPPLIAGLYADWRAALTALIVTQTGIGIIKLRYS